MEEGRKRRKALVTPGGKGREKKGGWRDGEREGEREERREGWKARAEGMSFKKTESGEKNEAARNVNT